MISDVGALLESHRDLSADYTSLEFDRIIAMAGKITEYRGMYSYHFSAI